MIDLGNQSEIGRHHVTDLVRIGILRQQTPPVRLTIGRIGHVIEDTCRNRHILHRIHSIIGLRNKHRRMGEMIRAGDAEGLPARSSPLQGIQRPASLKRRIAVLGRNRQLPVFVGLGELALSGSLLRRGIGRHAISAIYRIRGVRHPVGGIHLITLSHGQSSILVADIIPIFMHGSIDIQCRHTVSGYVFRIIHIPLGQTGRRMELAVVFDIISVSGQYLVECQIVRESETLGILLHPFVGKKLVIPHGLPRQSVVRAGAETAHCV